LDATPFVLVRDIAKRIGNDRSTTAALAASMFGD